MEVVARARSLALNAAERRGLWRLRASGQLRMRRRAKAVLLMAEGRSGVQVAWLTGYTPVQVSRIRGRFAAERTAGLRDRPRSGRPQTVSARQRSHIVALRGGRRGSGGPSSREVAERVGISHSTVHRIWRAHGRGASRSRQRSG